MSTTLKLTERHEKTLRRLLRDDANKTDGTSCIDMALAQQLARRGLVMLHGVHERKEWNRVVARLRVVTLTPAGREMARTLTTGQEASRDRA